MRKQKILAFFLFSIFQPTQTNELCIPSNLITIKKKTPIILLFIHLMSICNQIIIRGDI